jgi:hypothetical protein
MRVAILTVCTLVLGWPVVGAAQLPLDKVFDRVTDLSISVVAGDFWPRSRQLKTERGALVGAGVEVLFEVGGMGRLTAAVDPTPQIDTTLTELTVTTRPGEAGRHDDTLSVSKKYAATVTRDRGEPRFLLELGLGYSQHTYFQSRNDSIDLHGSLQELPSVALYVTDQGGDWITWYWTLRTGLVRLQDVRAYTPGDTVYPAGGSAMQVGTGFGALLARERTIGAFIELDWNYRRFGGVDWTPVDQRVPRELPRTLSFTGWSLAFGAQVQFRKPE